MRIKVCFTLTTVHSLWSCKVWLWWSRFLIYRLIRNISVPFCSHAFSSSNSRSYVVYVVEFTKPNEHERLSVCENKHYTDDGETNRLVRLTIKHELNVAHVENFFLVTGGRQWLYMLCFDSSRSLKIIDLNSSLKPIYNFLLVINSNLISISHCFRDMARSKTSHSTLVWTPSIKGVLFEFPRQTYRAGILLLLSENRVILSSRIFVTIHSRHRQTRD